MIPIGEGIFETLRVVDSRPHALTRHLERLRGAAADLGLPAPDLADLRSQIDDHLRATPLPYGRMRVSWFSDGQGATSAIASAPTPKPLPSVALGVSSWRVPAAGPLVGLKSTDYLDYQIALRHAHERGFDEALLANTAGDVCEATTANLFFVLDDVLCTPALSTGCLPGIARGLVIELCGAAEVEVPLDVLRGSTEVFLTSSLRAVQPVSRIDDHAYPETGPFTVAAQEAWRDLADKDWDPAPAATEYENPERVR